MKRFIPVLLCIVVVALGWVLILPAANYTVEQVLSAVFDGTDSINMNINQSAITGNTTIGGTLGVTGATTLTGAATLNGELAFTGCTIADGDATPAVTSCVVLTTVANTGATEITDLDLPVVGAVYILIGGSATNSSTITDGGNFALSANWTAGVDETLILYVQADNDYVELSRSTN